MKYTNANDLHLKINPKLMLKNIKKTSLLSKATLVFYMHKYSLGSNNLTLIQNHTTSWRIPVMKTF